MATLQQILEAQLRQKALGAAKRIHTAFRGKILGTDYSREFGDLDRQGDLSPLIPGKRDRYGHLSVPDAIAADLSGPRISWENNTTISVAFGHRPSLVKMSPLIMWYEYGYHGEKSRLNESKTFAPGFFSKKSARRVGAWYWVDAEFMQRFFTKKPFKSYGRYNEGMLFRAGHRVIYYADEYGPGAVKSTGIPRVGMFSRALIGIKAELPNLISGKI